MYNLIEKYIGIKYEEIDIDKLFEGIDESRKSNFVGILIGKGYLKKTKDGKLVTTGKGKVKNAAEKLKKGLLGTKKKKKKKKEKEENK